MFKEYKKASERLTDIRGTAKNFIQKSAPLYQTFTRRKLVSNEHNGEPIFNPKDFTRVEADIVKNIFDNPLNLEAEADEFLNKRIEVLYGNPTSEDHQTTLISTRADDRKAMSAYHSRIASNFASYYSPLEAPFSFSKSLIWYRRLLANTPIIFFFKQKQHLFSEASLIQYNFAEHTLRENVRQLKKKYFQDDSLDKRVRNYYFSDLVTTDILSLAINSENLKTLPEECSGSRDFWKLLESSDELIEYIRRQPRSLFDRELSFEPPEESKNYSAGKTNKTIGEDLHSKKDIEYNDYFILTIEEAVLRDDHSSLLDVIANMNDIELCAVRINHTKAATEEVIHADKNKPKSSYERLLGSAADGGKDRMPLEQLYKRLGEWGFTTVKANNGRSAWYLFKDSKTEAEIRHQ